jgi:hypothetical protein
MDKDAVNYQFKQMVAKNYIYKVDEVGYQKYEFKNVVPIMSS